ncbi:MAG: hydroxyacid dehydrogenase [Candidatus Raymondbacteria bacterium RifOxyA12_full_50_37]|uniref:Hydroxyacid dehydrogenase n=1 Tax=Candidatus Raymondbacteria bacterium RIFOXYD12_FULL_49_13 TaxID=1817890 RepID=A0A1F7F4Z9_UNCRA|nr:MAG: hydroxyacid dehydrogenase [Candidatus Raymondbacteria bacterium RifOxyA12_full_50_37]OGJ91893.1 MAG: hydroxyacid dehydrogenase [Candidatus Raymondbacteria bacterium RIFOXYA2_FULL_49_16]OGJ91934.1 MAG: hydroxyacid dehydrogenase [Candidatus Raymondbacteria bacterium RifOxyB12_full_50_8]OGJ96007.1 MAG: hydroxyacid dehydrogenase [Candidatus Raymondbacteria bacterium RifOxyC12_full_50_8]OGJ98069.1 MAG: hydroxyacid dehydrogenase [Candidatus Raymondbacteria bacterium RIFOXYC2_FULL_50_21]OGK01
MEKKIAFFDAKPYDRLAFDTVNSDFGFSITYIDAHLNAQTVRLTTGFDAVCAFVNDILDGAVIGQLAANGIHIAGLRCAGYNNVDFKAAFGKVHVVRVPAYSPHAIAEHAVALMLSLNRKIHKAYHRTRDGNFSINGLLGFDMYGKTAGVVGTGKIGQCLITILKGFGMRVLAYDPKPNQDYAREAGITFVSLEQLYSESDILSLHCPLTPETEHMINVQAISMMKNNIMIINTGRGKLIDTEALINALKSGKAGSAGLDVYEEESDYFFEDRSTEMIRDDILARLLTFPNVLITSHQAFFTEEALTNIAQTTLGNFKEYFDGGWLKNEICYRCGAVCPKEQNKRCF